MSRVGYVKYLEIYFVWKVVTVACAYILTPEADLTKLVGKLCDQLQQKKAVRVEIQNCIQKLKIELLRKKTVLTRRSLSFRDTVKRKEAEFGRTLESILQPAIERIELRYRDVDYDIVSGDGLVGTAASLQSIPLHKSATFLRSYNSLRKSVEEHILKISAISSYQDELQELQELLLVNLNFHKERKLLCQAFLCPRKDVSIPLVLRDWSTVGSTSASVVWRCCGSVQNIDAFLLYYRPVCSAEKKRRHTPQSLDSAHLATLTNADLIAAGFSRIRVHRFVPKRSQAVLRNLQSATDYVLILFGTNQLARSLPSIVFFRTTPSDDSRSGGRTFSRHRPVARPICDCLRSLIFCMLRVAISILLFVYILISALLIVVYRDTVYGDLCYFLRWTELSEVICSACQLEPIDLVPRAANEPSYFAWLCSVLSR